MEAVGLDESFVSLEFKDNLFAAGTIFVEEVDKASSCTGYLATLAVVFIDIDYDSSQFKYLPSFTALHIASYNFSRIPALFFRSP